ncbi:hypothetical protein V6Z11_D13G113700 [Gossypium hirsutum]
MASVKTTSKTAESSKASATKPKTFFNAIAATRYNTNIVKRHFYFEQGFLFKDESYMGYDEYVYSIVETHGWNIFCLHPKNVLGKIVHKFYAYVNSLDSSFIYIKGTSIPFDEDHINAQSGLTGIQDEQTPFAESITIEGLNQVNVGRIIFQEVHRYAEKNAGNLNFLSLITALCRTTQVPLNVKEDITLNKGGLTRTIFSKIQDTDVARATQHSHATTFSTVHTPTTAPPASHSSLEQ